MILTGLLVYLPAATRAGSAILVCVLSTSILMYSRPHQNVVLLWVCFFSFTATTMKYLATVMGSSQDLLASDESARIFGIFLIGLDVAIMIAGFIAIVLIFFVLHLDIKEIHRKEKLLNRGIRGIHEIHRKEKLEKNNPSKIIAHLKKNRIANSSPAEELKIGGTARKRATPRPIMKRRTSWAHVGSKSSVERVQTHNVAERIELENQEAHKSHAKKMELKKSKAQLRVRQRLQKRNLKKKSKAVGGGGGGGDDGDVGGGGSASNAQPSISVAATVPTSKILPVNSDEFAITFLRNLTPVKLDKLLARLADPQADGSTLDRTRLSGFLKKLKVIDVESTLESIAPTADGGVPISDFCEWFEDDDEDISFFAD